MSRVHGLPILTREKLLEERGVGEVRALTPKLGFFFRDETRGDYGIDAHIELFKPTADPNKHEMTGRLIAVQIKCGETIARSSDDAWKVYCTHANANYWLQHALPVILVYCDPTTNSCYWVQVDDQSLKRTQAGATVSIPKTNKLEDAKDALVAIASGRSAAALRNFPRIFTLPIDEESGLKVENDEELGVMCAEIVVALSGGHKPEIAVDIAMQLEVAAKLDELAAKPALSIDERKERLRLDEIDRRYQRKRANIAAAIPIMLAHPYIGKAYFGGQGDVVQGQALRRLVDSFAICIPRTQSTLLLDVFPSIIRQWPTICLQLDEHEKQSLIESVGLPNFRIEWLAAGCGFTTSDLPQKVFKSKLLPLLTKVLMVLAQRLEQSVDELIADIGVPIEGWMIGLR